MLKREYHCLVAGLPDLFFNENKLVTDSVDLLIQLKMELSPSDYELVKLIYLQADNENLQNLLLRKKASFNPKGIFSESYLQLQLSPENELPELPEYMLQFLEWIKETEQKELNLNAEIILQQLYYEYILQTNNEFLKNWFLFQLNLKNILTAVNCIQFDYSTEEHLIRVNENKNVCLLLTNRKFKPEWFEDEIPYHREIFKITESSRSWMERETALDKLKWDYLDEYTFFYYFTIEKILGYILKLQMVERWTKLNKKSGEELLKKLIDDFAKTDELAVDLSQTK
ncbi:DUF2764 family protein [Maribellus sp. YY47]|uniref:DUF2764 family protein n=1 Tax=Maribellus sp. YY47 TaxID=2929486 RepID=UPI002001CC13|nr:DUF2764 family protein [Maribellus sp. YY47]MCK3684487.1 DUF2764 domain-containing protein [Maribellus sp. YY47]